MVIPQNKQSMTCHASDNMHNNAHLTFLFCRYKKKEHQSVTQTKLTVSNNKWHLRWKWR